MNTTKLSRWSPALVAALMSLAIAPVLRADSLIYTSAVDITNYQRSWLSGDYLYTMKLPTNNAPSLTINQGDTLSGLINFSDWTLTNAASLTLANTDWWMGTMPVMGIMFTQASGSSTADVSFTIAPTNVTDTYSGLDFSSFTNTASYIGGLGAEGMVGIGNNFYGPPSWNNFLTFGGFNYSIDVTNLTDTASYTPDYVYFQLFPSGGGFNGDQSFPSGSPDGPGGPVSSVPEPSSFAMLAIGGLLLGGYAWRKKKRTA